MAIIGGFSNMDNSEPKNTPVIFYFSFFCQRDEAHMNYLFLKVSFLYSCSFPCNYRQVVKTYLKMLEIEMNFIITKLLK